ncbi:MAG: type II secretion system protein [Phycisphaerales bacterium]|jgi:type II secretory pathway pseudopilin PulG|nr:type II secretion system protein [Phycisphaerales bacterium]
MTFPANQASSRSNRLRRSRGFTIVEVLAVVGIIAALMGLILAGLQAASRTTRRTQELSTLRQLHLAWASYSASNNDYVMPGYLDETAQERWRVKYRYQVSGRVDPSICQTYPWRLLPYLDWGYEPILGYQPDENDNVPSKGKTGVIEPEALEVADQPWFGYNAYYVGGWWDTDSSGNTLCRFSNSIWAQDNGSGAPIQTKGKLVLRTIGRAAQGSSLILFGGSTYRAPGIYREDSTFLNGSPWITPHILADQMIWNPYTGMIGGVDSASASTIGDILCGPASLLDTPLTLGAGGIDMEVFTAQAVPYRRHGAVSLVHLDGSTGSEGIGNLTDQRRWINAAHDGLGNPNEFSHSPN